MQHHRHHPAIGVFIDAFVVRMTIVPAVMSLLGRHAWAFPGWLERVVPALDVEGAALDAAAGPTRGPLGQRVPTGAATSASACSLSGELRGPAGVPLAGAAATLSDHAGQQVAATRSDSAGRYHVEVPSPGRYLLIVARPDLEPVAHLVQVGAGATTHDATLRGACSVRGAVRGSTDGAGVPGARIVVSDERGEIHATAEADSQGRYVIGGLLAGTYVLTVGQAGRHPAAHGLVLSTGAHVTWDVLLPDGGDVSGTITAAVDGSTIAEAVVSLIDENGTVVAVTASDMAGSYTFAGVATGTYTVTAAVAYSPAATSVRVDDGKSASGSLELPSPRRESKQPDLAGTG